MTQFTLHQKTFLLLLAIVTIGFGWILWPFFGAVFSGVVFAILFAPLYRRLLRGTRKKPNAAALITLLSIVVMVILPLSMVGASLIDQATRAYELISPARLDSPLLSRSHPSLPQWLVNVLERFDLTNLATLQQRLSAVATQVSQMVATQAISLGRNTFDFLVSLTVMLYLLFSCCATARSWPGRVRNALPLSRKYKQRLFTNFTTVIRATVKGNVLVAAAQGAPGGLICGSLA